MLKRNLIIVFSIVLLLFAWFLSLENNSLNVTRIEIKHEAVPVKFNGYKIVQISDLHGKMFGSDQGDLVAAVKKANPDLIVVTGDLIDRRDYDDNPGIMLLERVEDVAPTYFVTGNHEWWSGRFNALEEKLVASGVAVLRGDHVKIERDNQSLFVVGIDDVAKYFDAPDFGDSVEARNRAVIRELAKATEGITREDFTILLAHRPENMSIYSDFGMDLILSGHTHGGQVNLPFIGALVAPDQGFFPKYSAGVYEEDGSTMIVNRGLGSSIFPVRLLNRPEIVVVTLRSQPQVK